jgi:hypothetical protein
MAKELPYFKFEPDQWENGTIQMCSKAQKGLFIDLCSVYWSRLGELPYALALQKHCNGDASELQALIDNDIIGLVNNQIIIEFLDEQLDEFQKTSDKRRDAANKRWNKDANALQLQSKSNAIREDEIKEDKIKEEVEDVKFSFRKSLYELGIDKTLVDDFLANRKLKKLANTKTAFEMLLIEFGKTNQEINSLMTHIVSKGWGSFKNSWLENDTKFSGKQTNETATVYKPSQKSKSSLDQLRAEEEAYQNQLRNAK